MSRREPLLGCSGGYCSLRACLLALYDPLQFGGSDPRITRTVPELRQQLPAY